MKNLSLFYTISVVVVLISLGDGGVVVSQLQDKVSRAEDPSLHYEDEEGRGFSRQPYRLVPSGSILHSLFVRPLNSLFSKSVIRSRTFAKPTTERDSLSYADSKWSRHGNKRWRRGRFRRWNPRRHNRRRPRRPGHFNYSYQYDTRDYIENAYENGKNKISNAPTYRPPYNQNGPKGDEGRARPVVFNQYQNSYQPGLNSYDDSDYQQGLDLQDDGEYREFEFDSVPNQQLYQPAGFDDTPNNRPQRHHHPRSIYDKLPQMQNDYGNQFQSNPLAQHGSFSHNNPASSYHMRTEYFPLFHEESVPQPYLTAPPPPLKNNPPDQRQNLAPIRQPRLAGPAPTTSSELEPEDLLQLQPLPKEPQIVYGKWNPILDSLDSRIDDIDKLI